MTAVVNTSTADRRLSPANSFTPDMAFLTVGPVRLDLDDPAVCDELAALLTKAAESLRARHEAIDVGGRD